MTDQRTRQRCTHCTHKSRRACAARFIANELFGLDQQSTQTGHRLQQVESEIQSHGLQTRAQTVYFQEVTNSRLDPRTFMPSSNIVIILVAVVEHHCLLTGVATQRMTCMYSATIGMHPQNTELIFKDNKYSIHLSCKFRPLNSQPLAVQQSQ